MHKDLKKKCTK